MPNGVQLQQEKGYGHTATMKSFVITMDMRQLVSFNSEQNITFWFCYR